MATKNQALNQVEDATPAPAANVNDRSKNVVSTRGIDQELSKPTYNVKELSLKAADEAIVAIATGGKALRKLAHETACGIMLHYAKHGDYTRLQRENDQQPARMVEAVQSAFSRSMGRAFIDWTVRYSSLRYNEETGRFYHNKRDKRIASGDRGFFDFAAAIDNPFFDYERDWQAPKAVDGDELIRQFISRMENLLRQKTEGVENPKTKKKVHIAHAIDEKVVVDLKDFAVKHGVKLEAEAA